MSRDSNLSDFNRLCEFEFEELGLLTPSLAKIDFDIEGQRFQAYEIYTTESHRTFDKLDLE
jgi:hypothetical protein